MIITAKTLSGEYIIVETSDYKHFENAFTPLEI